MTTPLLPTWATRELPILAGALRRLDAGVDLPDLEEIQAEAGLDVAQMRAGLKALEEAFPPYLSAQQMLAGPDRVVGFVTSVSERARRELGTWPSAENLVDDLAAALERAAAAESEPERRSRLAAAGQALAGMAKDVAVGVIAAKLGGL